MRPPPLICEKAAQSRLWNPLTQTMPRKELDDLHLRKIRRLIEFAYENSPPYRVKYEAAGFHPSQLRTWDDYYQRVPFMDKPDLLADRERFIPAQALPDEYLAAYFRTSGTTGKTLRESFSEWDTIIAGLDYMYSLWDAGIRPGDRAFLALTFGPWMGQWEMYYSCQMLGLHVVPGGGATTYERLMQILDVQPRVVFATPTYMLHLLEIAREKGIDLASSSVEFLVGGGEAGLNVPITRRQLEDGWGARCIDLYGISEAGMAQTECAAHPGGVHIVEDCCHAYAMDPASGRPAPAGDLGELVITSYAHLAQPIIKYRTHDLVRHHREHDHGCGWSWAFLEGSVIGRTDFMVTIRGLNVFPTAVENLLLEVPGLSTFYEIHISREKGLDRMLVRVEAAHAGGSGELQAMADRLQEVYRAHLGVRLEVQVLPPGSLPRYELKSKRIFDHRQAG